MQLACGGIRIASPTHSNHFGRNQRGRRLEFPFVACSSRGDNEQELNAEYEHRRLLSNQAAESSGRQTTVRSDLVWARLRVGTAAITLAGLLWQVRSFSSRVVSCYHRLLVVRRFF